MTEPSGIACSPTTKPPEIYNFFSACPFPLPPHNKGRLAQRIPGTFSPLQSQLLILHTPQPQGWKVSSPSFSPNTASTVLLLYLLRVMLLSPLLSSPPCSHHFPATILAVHPLKTQALGLSFSSTLSSLLSTWLAGFCVNVSPNSVAQSISFFSSQFLQRVVSTHCLYFPCSLIFSSATLSRMLILCATNTASI